MTGVHVDRNENIIHHNWYKFLLWILVLGGLALLGWLIYGGYQWGWHANPCKPPCSTAVPTAPTTPSRTTRRPSPAPRRPTAAATKPAPVAPQQVQISGNLDLVHHGGQVPIAGSQQPQPASNLTPEELDEATARWLEGQRRNP